MCPRVFFGKEEVTKSSSEVQSCPVRKQQLLLPSVKLTYLWEIAFF